MSDSTHEDELHAGKVIARAILGEVKIKRDNRLIGPETTREERLAWLYLAYAKLPPNPL
jgi:hypothetical protein